MSERLALEGLLAQADGLVAHDPFANPFLLFALQMTERLEAGGRALDEVEAAVGDLGVEAFAARAGRLGAYLAVEAPDRADRRLRRVFETLADGGFDAYADALERPAVGLVLTGHPTFALGEALSEALVELATGADAEGAPLDAGGREVRLAQARRRPHAPPSPLTIDVEHAWSMRALENAVDALRAARRTALAVARERWPDRWATLDPQLLTLATWVGFDQDGRTDITWEVSLAKRLELKRAALRRWSEQMADLGLDDAHALVREAMARVDAQIAAVQAIGQGGPAAVAALGRRLAADREHALVDPAPLARELDLALAGPTLDDDVRERLLALRAALHAQGPALARIQVRLNSSQLHNAVRNESGLELSPDDPSERRRSFEVIDGLIEGCEPRAVSFESLLVEPTSAKRLMITIAQMSKFVDAVSPVRFLIAETESGFTLLAALHLARLYGVERLVEISPLFETQEALVRGEAVIEEALRSPAFRAYVVAQGRLTVQFGFSDSGRFIGQMAATFRIERLRLRLAELLVQEGLAGVEVVLFNTHGESIGRGGHPASLQDRLAYAAPARSRAEFAARGLRVREEDSFQGGDGYLPFFTPAAARASVCGLLAWGLAPVLGDPEAEGDAIYAAPAYASDFFATVEQVVSELVAHPDYPALLGVFGLRLLPKTGSRPNRRETGGHARALDRVSDLRAIPNNAVLQGLGFLANTVLGVGRAAARDPGRYAELRASSPRFRRAMAMAETAAALGDLQATRAYAATLNPSLWLDRRMAGLAEADAALLADIAERATTTGKLSRVLRRIRSHPAVPPPPQPAVDPERRARVRLLHAVRIGLIQHAALLAAAIPAFAPRFDTDRDDLRLRVLRLELPQVVEKLRLLFPFGEASVGAGLDYGEPDADLRDQQRRGYSYENEMLIRPLERVHALLLATTGALNHELGACG